MTTPANPDDLITWLRAQLDNDERAARAVEGIRQPWYFELIDDAARPLVELALDPARVLAEVDAKRRILDAGTPRSEHESPGEYIYFGDWSSCTDDCPGTVWYETVKLLALPYADRPGYREEWRP